MSPKRKSKTRTKKTSSWKAKASKKPRKTQSFNWTKSRLKLLGTEPDSKLANKWKVGTTTVYKKRNELGIASFGKSNKDTAFKWSKRALNLLGKESDQKIAERLDISVSTVATKRRQLKIPSVRQKKGQRLGREARKWKASEIKLLGKHTDTWVANKLKMGRRHVYAKRLELGIASLTESLANKMWTENRLSRLGKVPDRKLAVEIGVTVATVSNRRQAMGIESYRDQQRKLRNFKSQSKPKSMQKKSADKDAARRPRRGK